jgi:hypothetical protein
MYKYSVKSGRKKREEGNGEERGRGRVYKGGEEANGSNGKREKGK